MKKTLVAILGLSSFVIASGKVELVNEAKATVVTPGTEKKFVFNEKKDLEVTHKLKAEIKENNILAEVELGTSAKLVDGTNSKKTYEFGKAVTGFVKAGYDNGKLASSLKYDFGKKETFINASYKYTDGKLTLKPNAELKLEVLSPAKLTLANETSYKFDNMLTLKNESKLFTSVYGMKDETELPKYIVDIFGLTANTTKLFGLNSKLTAEYKATDEVKLFGNLYGEFESKKLLSKKDSKKTERELKTYGVAIDGKVEFVSNSVKGLKSDMKLKYGFTNTKEHVGEEVLGFDYKGNNKKHSFELDSNVSYLVDLTNGFELTPAFNLNYKNDLIKFEDSVSEDKGSAVTKKNELVIKPSAKLSYKNKAFLVGLNLESPFEFKGTSIDLSKYEDVEAELLDKVSRERKFGFDKGSLKATLSLSYKW